eukprot:TRINITY_DN9829_c0_g1_i3.p4 TRINITY_DN9829_c0_g1~~TRINITY_DN9829_c0_g1_i3.p4  ORF type:complete len:151 (+),score=23.46 TRINITY_DN9829_c0_g1_i3:469-921(+)
MTDTTRGEPGHAGPPSQFPISGTPARGPSVPAATGRSLRAPCASKKGSSSVPDAGMRVQPDPTLKPGKTDMSNQDAHNENGAEQPRKIIAQQQERWTQITTQLQARIGAEVFSSWFGRMKLDCVGGGVALHTVPTAFLPHKTKKKKKKQQ